MKSRRRRRAAVPRPGSISPVCSGLRMCTRRFLDRQDDVAGRRADADLDERCVSPWTNLPRAFKRRSTARIREQRHSDCHSNRWSHGVFPNGKHAQPIAQTSREHMELFAYNRLAFLLTGQTQPRTSRGFGNVCVYRRGDELVRLAIFGAWGREAFGRQFAFYSTLI